MAPELYEEKYSTPVDIYAFGMCLLEMVSQGSPFNECSTPGQVYKKVIAGEKPIILRRIKDDQLLVLTDQCIMRDPSCRPTAKQLLENKWLAENEADGNQLCELLAEAEKSEEELRQRYVDLVPCDNAMNRLEGLPMEKIPEEHQ